MRYGEDHKEQTRARVLKEAAREIRAKGPDGIGVAAIMARAGLTHGGFYAHFKSKDALVAAALDTMFDDAQARFEQRASDANPRTALRSYVDFYLSTLHRDARDRGCALPSLSGDLARGDAGARARFGQGLAGLNGRVAEKLRLIGHADPERSAASLIAELVGAVALARAVADIDQSDAILASAHASIVARFGLGDMA
ncbi:TetR/AcrR family transcriptional regulator [Sphingomonas sp. JC676]|uniref:TetR/AcrR family transcriptional regulator n=1 Tax=Sphingomonas sp. JC676 TaxID=2768065 RepID=UPI00165847D6|nr:TetR/AcrR family transcriptional regulator [Sphingomonas sp. JC676]MBC9031868.1 TetR/AcrR family transcriptional regulator [Sphingomonas sp. JC676]